MYAEGDVYYNLYGAPSDCEGIRKQLLKDFTFKPITDEDNLKVLKQIKSTNSVSIHARVADYEYGMEKAVKQKYFIRAVNHIKKKVEKPTFFLFSDNMEWVRNHLDVLGLSSQDKIVFVDHNKGENSYRDMQLMSKCKHNIVPNSTFSWWGAYLNRNPNKIVCTPLTALPGTISF